MVSALYDYDYTFHRIENCRAPFVYGECRHVDIQIARVPFLFGPGEPEPSWLLSLESVPAGYRVAAECHPITMAAWWQRQAVISLAPEWMTKLRTDYCSFFTASILLCIIHHHSSTNSCVDKNSTFSVSLLQYRTEYRLRVPIKDGVQSAPTPYRTLVR